LRHTEDKIKHAEIRAKELVLKAQEEALHIAKKAEDEVKRSTQDLIELEKKLQSKESNLSEADRKLKADRERLEKEKIELSQKRDEILAKLERASKLTQQQAKELILSGWEEKLKGEIARRVKSAEEEIKATADEKAKELLVDAMRYGAVDYTAEYAITTVALPSDEYKGRIIGKEGRNIRAFELATGVDVDLEEEGSMKFSSFDAIRREIARVSMERLIKDGRIQPERIEEIVEKTKSDLDKIIAKAGEEMCHSVGVYNLPLEVMALLGRFKYRFAPFRYHRGPR
jgi:ribonuclease Y